MTQQPRESGPDLVGEFQRWLVRSGARGVSRELGDHFRTVLGRGEGAGDVWESATAPPPPPQAPECAWCPVCRAARLLRESGPGLTSHVSTAGDVLTAVVQEAVSVIDSALANVGRPAGPATSGTAPSRPPSAWDEAAAGDADGTEKQSRHTPADGADSAGPGESPPHVPDDRD